MMRLFLWSFSKLILFFLSAALSPFFLGDKDPDPKKDDSSTDSKADQKDSKAVPDASKFQKRISLKPSKQDEPDKSSDDSSAQGKKSSDKPEGEKSKSKEQDGQSKDKDSDDEKKINPNLNNVSLSSFIKYMAELKKINLVPSADANDSKVTLTVREALPIDRAWEVFLTVLDSCGFCLVKIGDVQKVMKKDAAVTEPIPVVIGASEKNLPESSAMVRAVVFLKNIPVQQAEALVKTFLDPKAQTYSQQSINVLVLTDRAINIKSALSILNELDNSGVKETCCVIRLSNSTAGDVKKFLDDVIKRPETSALARLLGQQSDGGADFFPGTVKLIADDRTNSIIMLGIENSLKRLASFIDQYFEGNWQTRTPFETYICEYTDAGAMKTTLDSIINDDATKNSRNARGLGSVRMESDQYSNKLIIYAQDGRDLAIVKSLIRELDKPQPMVAIETMIVQVTDTDMRELGGKLRARSPNSPFKSVDFQGAGSGTFTPELDSSNNLKSLMGNLLQLAGGGVGSSIFTFGAQSKQNVWALMKAFQTRTVSNSIEKPFVTVANGYAATLHSGTTRSVKFEADSGSSTVSYKQIPASTDLNITPQISPDGLIRLDLNLVTEDFQGATAGNETDANKLSKTIKTKVTLADGGFLVLGGFVKTNYGSTYNKSPIFGDIPFLGWFAKDKQNTITKTYTFMFIAPTIVKPLSTPGTGLYTKIKLHSARDTLNEDWNLNSKDPVGNWFFEEKKLESAHKIVDFANAKYQPTTVDIKNDELYRGKKISMQNFYKDVQSTQTTTSKMPIGDDFINIISKERIDLPEDIEASDIVANFHKEKDKEFTKEDPNVIIKHEPFSVKAPVEKSTDKHTIKAITAPMADKKPIAKYVMNDHKTPEKKATPKPDKKPTVKKPESHKQSAEKPKPVILAHKTPETKVVKPQEQIRSHTEDLTAFGDSSNTPSIFMDLDEASFDREIVSRSKRSGNGHRNFANLMQSDLGDSDDSRFLAQETNGNEQDMDDFDRKVHSKMLGRPRMVSL